MKRWSLRRREVLAGLLATAAAPAAQAKNALTRGLGAAGAPAPPPVSGPIGFSAVVQLFGTATYNSDGTVSGTPNGATYTYNPDTPGANQSALSRGTFTSDFASFSCSSIECQRTDTALRVIFR